MKPLGIGRIPRETQEIILTLGRRWPVARIAFAMSMDPAAVAGCLDAWGLPRLGSEKRPPFAMRDGKIVRGQRDHSPS